MGIEELVDAWNGAVGAKAREDIAEWHELRESTLPTLHALLDQFLAGDIDVTAFRSAVDSFAKSEPHWGFKGTALMFFTQLWKAAEHDALTAALHAALPAPQDEADARQKIEAFVEFVMTARERAEELELTRPQVGRTNFFLSFFWEARERAAWPIYFPNSRDVLADEGLLELVGAPADNYLAYRTVMLRLAQRVGSVWQAEGLLWQLGSDAVAPPSPFRLNSDVAMSWFIEEEGRSLAAKQRALEEATFTGWLSDVHGLLARDDLHFGYRVIDEISIYVGHAVQLVQGEPERVLQTAFDLQLVQKIVPKFAGGRELEEPLARLLRYCLDAEVGGPATTGNVLQLAESTSDPIFPRAARKLTRMLRTLQRIGFVAALQ